MSLQQKYIDKIEIYFKLSCSYKSINIMLFFLWTVMIIIITMINNVQLTNVVNFYILIEIFKIKRETVM